MVSKGIERILKDASEDNGDLKPEDLNLSFQAIPMYY